MKNIILIFGVISVIFSSFFVETTTAEENGFCNNAADCAQVDQQIANNANSSSSAGGSPVTVIVTEKVPGATCTCIVDGNIVKKDDEGNDIPPAYSEANCGDPKTRKYQCTVEKGMTSFQNMIREIVRWFVYIIMLLGVLAIVGAGILWAWGSDSEEYTKKAKGWAINIIVGIALLFTFRYILGFLAPWIFQ